VFHVQASGGEEVSRYPSPGGMVKSYLATWIIPLFVLGSGLFFFWPMVVFRHSFTVRETVYCYQDMGASQCSGWSGDALASFTRVAHHSAVTHFGAGLTVAWIVCWFLLAMTGSVLGRRQRARRRMGY
jgi:hypothetical protein